MTDYINRHDLLGVLATAAKAVEYENRDKMYGLLNAMDIAENMPAADVPKQLIAEIHLDKDELRKAVEEIAPHWVPVLEGLPDTERQVLVTLKHDEDDYEVSIGEFWGMYDKSEQEYGWGRWNDKVIAWCELPKPYQGEREYR